MKFSEKIGIALAAAATLFAMVGTPTAKAQEKRSPAAFSFDAYGDSRSMM